MPTKKRPQKRKKGNKRAIRSRKRLACAKYRLAGRREKNKIRKLKKHLKKQPNDANAREVLHNL